MAVTVYIVLEDGETLKVVDVPVPGAHCKVAPEEAVAVSVTLLPSQTDLFEDIETVGAAVTTTRACAVSVHPTLLVPVTANLFVDLGQARTVVPVVDERVSDALLPFMLAQVYVLAPVAVRTARFPTQMVALLTDTVGTAFTVTVTLPVAEQLGAVLSVTVAV